MSNELTQETTLITTRYIVCIYCNLPASYLSTFPLEDSEYTQQMLPTMNELMP